MGKHPGNGRRGCQQGHDEDYTYDMDNHYYRQGYQGKQNLYKGGLYADDGGELFIEEIGLYWVKQGNYGKENKQIQNQYDIEVVPGDHEDIPKEVGGHIRRITGTQGDKEDSKAHPGSPEDTDWNIGIHARLSFMATTPMAAPRGPV